MFKIYDDKVYFVAETPDINKVIEIFLPKDDRGTIMNSHEIRVDLCRAVIHMEKKGVRVLKVRNIEDTNKASIDIWHMPEYQEAAESPVSDVVNPVTKEIVNRYCQKVFHLDGYEDYFIKTGTYSSKYEFRNAHIHNPKEINEMGEYFLFLNHLTCSMASPLNNRCFYGANTTNEWVVREYIKDKENNPTIYNGLPLHTEYRVFVDFDTKEILGASPYWRSDVMKNEFKKVSSPQERHDYVVYKMHEDILNQRYHESVQTVLAELKKVIPRIELTGQWSVDVMRNGNDYYIIDMALAENSALNDCVPKNLLRAYPQQWLPGKSNS